ncbi:MAG TPA: hypothetical protein VEZ20_13610, partial [Allosphingosinicella sp.]|nr:hypothetical protein [Allosphingosinicella sp.]
MDKVILLGREAGEFVVNTAAAGLQADPRVAKLASGGFVVVWTDVAGPTVDVRAQIYDAAGARLGGEIAVHASPLAQVLPRVAALASGGFAVLWAQEGAAESGAAQIFSASGNRIGAPITDMPGTGTGQLFEAAGLPGGGFVIVRGGGVGQVYDSAGAPVGAGFVVGGSSPASVTALSGGGFAVAAARPGGGNIVQIFDASGQKAGPELSHPGAAVIDGYRIASLDNGGFVVAWGTQYHDGSPDFAVVAQMFTAGGARLGGEILVNTTAPGNQMQPAVAGVPGGGFVATWSDQSTFGIPVKNVKGQVFDAEGRKAGTEFAISRDTDHPNTNHENPAVAMIGGDRLVVVWQGSGPGDTRDPEGEYPDGGIRAQILQALGSVALDIVPSKTIVSEIAVAGTPTIALSTASAAINATYRYELVSDTTGGAFSVRDYRIFVDDNRRLDFETAPGATVTVRVTDNAGNVAQEAIQLQIADAASELRLAGGNEIVLGLGQKIAALPGGGFVVVSAVAGWPAQVIAQLYDAAANKSGGTIVLASVDFQSVSDPNVAVLKSGNLAVTWTHNSFETGDDVRVQLLDPSGARIGSPFTANSAIAGNQHESSVVALSGGGFAVAWTDFSNVGDGSGRAVFAQLFGPAGEKVGGEFRVNTATNSHQMTPSLAALPNGGFVAVWQDASLVGGDTSFQAVKAQIFDAAGAKVGGEVLVNTSVLGSQGRPEVAVNADGTILVAWRHAHETLDVRGQMFTAAGGRIGGELVFGETAGFLSPSVAAGPAGAFVVSWYSLTPLDDQNGGSLAQLVDAAGAKLGDPFLLNLDISASEALSQVVMLADGTLAAMWNGPTTEVRFFTDVDKPLARTDAFSTSESSPLSGNLFADNGSGPDTGTSLQVTAVNGSAASVGQQIVLASGARVTVDANGTVRYDPAGAHDRLAPAGSGAANTQATDSFTYTVNGAATATVTIRVNGAESPGDIYLGSAGNDTITGTAAANTFLVHQGGVDTIRTSGGDDRIFVGFRLSEATSIDGGEGNDTLFLQSGGPRTLTAANLAGIETVFAMAAGDDRFGTAWATSVGYDLTIGDSALGAGRVLTIDGSTLTSSFPSPAALVVRAGGETDARYVITGGVGSDRFETGAGNDELDGGAGDDYLNGGAGADVMRGGAGNDIFFVDHAGDVVVENADEGIDNVQVSIAAYTASANVEQIVGTLATGQALTGNASANTISGGAGDDVLDGGAGIDSMAGGAGNDVYVVDHLQDSVYDVSGAADEIRTALSTFFLTDNHFGIENLTGISNAGQSLTGNASANVITGGAGNDTLSGGGGADLLRGRAGDDVYLIYDDSPAAIEEQAGEGTDEVRTLRAAFTLGENLENLTGMSDRGQALTGNALANVLKGGAGADTLDGKAGADTMIGGAGDDLYFADDAGDLVVEAAGGGNDEVRTALGAFTLAANVERLTGTSNAGQVLTGNALANVIVGGAGNDVLDGGAGADTMTGGDGDDVYIVDDPGDVVNELAGGTDEVRTALKAYALPGGAIRIENLTGLSSEGQTLTGNARANLIVGGAGDDVIEGGGNAD